MRKIIVKIFTIFSRLTQWIVPSRKYRWFYREFCASIDLKKDIDIVHKNYVNVLSRLKNKTDKIKVVFLIRENQKWTYQSLYEILDKSDKFEPLVLVSILTLSAKGKDKTRNNLNENYNFFKSKGMNVDYAYKDGKYIDLKIFNPDIIFYDQEWDLPVIHKPKCVSEFALTCYCSYGYELLEKEKAYTQEFHRFLYKFFVEHEENIKRYKLYNKHNAENCVVAGYPKLDLKANDVECELWRDNNKIKIIYAPHQSFEKKDIRLATFDKNGKFILELAKKHPETTWVFKPHPRFKYALLKNKIMNSDEIEKYYSEWAQIGLVYTEGDYSALMYTSDLMITDCCSFLAEYLSTLKPLIRLVNKQSIKLNSIGEIIMKGYYSAASYSELNSLFTDIIDNKKDDRKIIRKDIINEIIDTKETAAHKIYNYILNDVTKMEVGV